ncbi:phosphatase 2C-like domain-containing protein [Mycena maculata]|uniref:Phosphatase 2C-like domain-containing protein n=1 Tax=Mycena maculata TaxID=230809 RepID=A0AAD7MEP1_9AGAR|nr:phosphatase 2C-like domain-containing protein [Mycena maculata]
MRPSVVSVPAASSSENLLALAEVSHFGKTDMGHPGEGPWTFRILPEPFLTAELKRIACPRSNRKVDSLTFQPCSPHVYQNQDRFVVEEWNFPGGTWQFNSIFDGHVNHHTVDYVARTLPRNLKESLGAALRELGSRRIPPDRVSQIMRDSVVQLDGSISSNFLDIFPRDLRRLSRMTDREVKNTFQRDSTGRSRSAAARCLGGTTLVLSLTDPNEKNVWVANLGDCHAVLGLRHRSGAWTGTLMNHLHAGHDHREAQRVRAEHPREPDSVRNSRVLGFLEPTRAVGDTWLKIPSLYTSRVFSNLDQDWISQGTLKQCASRISTPPYVSNIPDVYHRDLPSRPWFLILCSDGLPSAEAYDGMDTPTMTRTWTEFVGQILDSHSPAVNTALSLLRTAIGGQDEYKVSRSLTVEMEERWMDDVSISIQRFQHWPN